MRKLLIIIIILLLLSGAVSGWWWYRDQTKGRAPKAETEEPTNNDLIDAFPIGEPVVEAPSPILPSSASAIPATTSPVTLNQKNLLNSRSVIGVSLLSATTSDSRFLFLEPATGLIRELDLESRELRDHARLPARGLISEAVWGNLDPKTKLMTVWFSTLSANNKTYSSATFTKSATTSDLGLPEPSPEPLGANISNLALAPDQNQIFTLEQVGNETIGKILDWKTKKSRLVFNSKLNQWLTAWPEKNTISLTTKPTSRGGGYLYFIDLKNNREELILANLNGLMTLVSADAKKVIYSHNLNGELKLSLYDRLKNQTIVLGVKTLAEKCVWSKDSRLVYCAVPRKLAPATYPDDWLSGEIFSSDFLWKINPETGASELVSADESSLGDVTNLILSADNQKLVFTERQSGELRFLENLGVLSGDLPDDGQSSRGQL